MSDLRALSIRQPWASAIALGWKPVENRSWMTHHRGPLAIHAGTGVGTKREFGDAAERIAELCGRSADTALDLAQTRGAIIAVADLTDVCEEAVGWAGTVPPHGCDCGPWAENESRHFKLANVHSLANPIPIKGALGLWRVPADAVALINAQVSWERAACTTESELDLEALKRDTRDTVFDEVRNLIIGQQMADAAQLCGEEIHNPHGACSTICDGRTCHSMEAHAAHERVLSLLHDLRST